MPSLERLIAEVEPNVITEALTRECIQVTSSYWSKGGRQGPWRARRKGAALRRVALAPGAASCWPARPSVPARDR
jgi:hypothetical protein